MRSGAQPGRRRGWPVRGEPPSGSRGRALLPGLCGALGDGAAPLCFPSIPPSSPPVATAAPVGIAPGRPGAWVSHGFWGWWWGWWWWGVCSSLLLFPSHLLRAGLRLAIPRRASSGWPKGEALTPPCPPGLGGGGTAGGKRGTPGGRRGTGSQTPQPSVSLCLCQACLTRSRSLLAQPAWVSWRNPSI